MNSVTEFPSPSLRSLQVHEVSGYDPRDLFSSSLARMLATLRALCLCPQNNLRVFHDGRNVLRAEAHRGTDSAKSAESTKSTGVQAAPSGAQDAASTAAELLQAKLAVADAASHGAPAAAAAAVTAAAGGADASAGLPGPEARSADASSATASSSEGLRFTTAGGADWVLPPAVDALPALPLMEDLEKLLRNFFGAETVPLPEGPAAVLSVDASALTFRGEGGNGGEDRGTEGAGSPTVAASWRVHALLELVVRCLQQSRVLEKLLEVQKMDR